MNMEEFIFTTNQAENVDFLFRHFESAMSDLGFDRVLLALMNDHPALRKEAEHGVVKNYPEDWVNYYLAQGYDEIDPVRTLAFTGTGAFTWDKIISSRMLTKKQIKMFDEASEAKLFSGIGVALHGGGGAVAALGAASTQKGVDTNPVILDRVNILAHQFYTCFWSLMEKQPADYSVILSARECEVLKWCARGFTKAETGDRLNLSIHTVDSHIRNILKKLDARNITAAVVMALNRGFIQI